MTDTQIEIMAPVGSYESLRAAIQAGAQSVYFGISRLNMRSRSSANFTLDDLKAIVEACHQNNVKAYITLNTIIYDEDVDYMKSIVDAAIEAGADAIIATDHSVLDYCYGKQISVHASTQLNISNSQSLKFYAQYCDVMVLARELNLDQIKRISEFIDKNNIVGPSGKKVRIEVFAHGALCMAVSGKCFISEHQHGASANRGACYQSCRREYKITDDRGEELLLDNNYILSPKDLNTLPILDKIIDSGVRVLKIEGRGRSPEYVKTIVEAYASAIELVKNHSFRPENIAVLEQKLATVFNRGFYEGHYLGKGHKDWQTSVSGSKATTRKEYIAKGIKYFSKIGVGEFQMESGSLKVGDKIYIQGPTTGVVEQEVTELHVDASVVNEVQQGDRFSIKVLEKIRPSDKMYLIVSVER